ncbi:hypothetical protein AURDEDRAFT_115235, partial [Auricularia subglabra TFB-10046 SS5]
MSLPHALTVIALAAAVFSAPSFKRADPDCTTQYAGVLSAPVTKNGVTTFKSFTLSSLGQTAYLGDGKSPLIVQFQHCTSLNLDQPPGSSANIGRLFVPGQGKCITITNQLNAVPPYYTTLATCGTDAHQRFGVFSGADLLWVGKTDEEGTDPQGGCGVLGYKSSVDGTPVITHTNQQITLECTNRHAFRIVTTV